MYLIILLKADFDKSLRNILYENICFRVKQMFIITVTATDHLIPYGNMLIQDNYRETIMAFHIILNPC